MESGIFTGDRIRNSPAILFLLSTVHSINQNISRYIYYMSNLLSPHVSYPNYPPELTRLTRRKLEDVLANLSFLALLASTLSLDATRPATLCFTALASRGCLPLEEACLGSPASASHLPPASLSASSSASSSSSSSSSLSLAPVPTDSLRINMNALVFPQLMFEVWVNLPLVFFEMSVATTRRAKALVGFYHAMRTCLRGECHTAAAADAAVLAASTAAGTGAGKSVSKPSSAHAQSNTPPCYICYWQRQGASGRRAHDKPTAAGALSASTALVPTDKSEAAHTVPAVAAEAGTWLRVEIMSHQNTFSIIYGGHSLSPCTTPKFSRACCN